MSEWINYEVITFHIQKVQGQLLCDKVLQKHFSGILFKALFDFFLAETCCVICLNMQMRW